MTDEEISIAQVRLDAAPRTLQFPSRHLECNMSLGGADAELIAHAPEDLQLALDALKRVKMLIAIEEVNHMLNGMRVGCGSAFCKSLRYAIEGVEAPA